jgi:hypothetical protein
MNGLRVKDVNDLHINFQTQQTQVFVRAHLLANAERSDR